MQKSFYDVGLKEHLVDDLEEISLGSKTLKFVHAKFLHWPETMMTYLIEDEILFSCDAFGAFGALEGRHFDDDVFVYGFHDNAPLYQVKDGGTYGIPYRALCVKGVENLYAIGMMITSDHRAHMSTRNTVSCMGQGQASGTAAALCAQKDYGSRQLPYAELRSALEQANVYFED